MNADVMTLGMKLDLELINSFDQRIGQPYVSQLMDIIDDKNIMIAAPIHETRLTLIPTGTRIRLIFKHSRYGLLNVLGIVSGKEKKGNLLTFSIIINGPIEKIQRRMYYRLPCILNVGYCLQKESESEADTGQSTESSEQKEEWKKGITKNISGSGVCIVVDEKLPTGSKLKIRINLGKGQEINVVCKVARCEKLENSISQKYELGLGFLQIEKKCQEAMVKFIFAQQNKLLRNNLGDGL